MRYWKRLRWENVVMLKSNEEYMEEIVKSLIYHGRHFAQSRDKVVVNKCMCVLKDIVHSDKLNKETKTENCVEKDQGELFNDN